MRRSSDTVIHTFVRPADLKAGDRLMLGYGPSPYSAWEVAGRLMELSSPPERVRSRVREASIVVVVMRC